MDRSRDIDGIVRSIVMEELRYLRHYLAKVENNNDPDMKGKVFVTIPSLGWDDPSKGQWARPRHLHGLSVPAIGEWVECYFVDGNVNMLAYMGIALEIQNMVPKNYMGQPTLHIVWEAPGDQEQVIKYDNNTKQADIKFTKIVFSDGTEAFVLGTTLDTWIQNTLKIWTDTHVHTSAAPGAPTSTPTVPLTAPTNYLSTTIKGK